MGYTTKFEGRLDFTSEPTLQQIRALKAMFGEDCREHPEWNPPKYAGYIDLKLTDDMLGIEWDDATEKCSDMADLLNIVIDQTRKTWPEFGLTGSLLAQGEDFDDRYYVVIGEDGRAAKQKIVPTGLKVTCPDCGHTFRAKPEGAA
jgi:hypothetical protein